MNKVAIALAVALMSRPVAAFAQPESSDAASPREKVVLSYFHDVLDGRQIGLLDSLFLSDCVIYRPEGTVKGMAGIRGVVERNIAAYSQFATEVHDVFESGDRVVVRVTHRATGAGVFRSRIGDHDVEGKQLTWSAIAIFRMQDGKIAEEWVNRDELGILLSAGALETRQSPTSIVGTWKVVKYEDQGADGTISYPYGEHPDGYFVYDATGHLSVHIMRTPALKTFPGMREGTGDVPRIAMHSSRTRPTSAPTP